MKVVILAGGLGTRISEESVSKPKPMIEIGGYPILWHIMKTYSYFGFNDFIICCGYKGYVIKEYFANYFLHQSDITFDMTTNQMTVHQNKVEPWKVTLVDTGAETQTGGRLKRVKPYLNTNEDFCFTYGDGVTDLDLSKLVSFHKEHKRLATVTGVLPAGRFGALEIENAQVIRFQEKPKGDGNFINGGFFVLNPSVLNYIKDDSTIWEREPMEKLAKDSQMSAFEYDGFWYAMDTLRDKNYLEGLWSTKKAPWAHWLK